MLTLLSPNYVSKPTSRADLAIASIAFGWTLGFGWLTAWTAYKQTRRVRQRYGITRVHTPYVVMIWSELVVCLTFSVVCWLHLFDDVVPPSFAFYFCILTLWALQVQFLLQIIVNRISILLTSKQRAVHLKIVVAVIITLINISVYCIWIPARLQISNTYIHLNEIWDRCEKSIYLVVDALLNFYFMKTVYSKLVGNGLKKYKTLIKFNAVLVVFSLAMDVLIIGMMSLDNSFVYMQFHPLAYLVKLNIEMSMAELIAKVSALPSNWLPPKKRTALKIGIQTDISIKHDDIDDLQTLELEDTINSPAPTISKEFDHGRPVVFAGEDYDDERGTSSSAIVDPRTKAGKGATWSNS
ncbi:hypothetical protein SS1G_02149 [Sclerotinia sclerotiorum 1980 UF-70]|uniref:Uncharacterized protein n=2 Tax=Sclerotinia sclerotiorum (strain ATCC 18683 / 1980 / Ss-1) TaxID=665079 RepID=A0A1D9Q0H8_SCLS1|nr:hypothetical protein SS1G_02149 [Sclerotinia sclerotiorum 1980 UF-70]APA08460.1 hypothetical protein sscle_04g032300 [Sclerotinia sclerotiorum 1980 UF-70]EDN99297.1 hypothetical protein SS1G_02149 [Sclerotinia sclerotiorum 1980 UF-70]